MSKSSLVLAMDSAMNGCSVALYGEGVSIARSEKMMRGQSEKLVPMIEDVMKEAGADYADLDRIAVTVGPGAFAGLRIGLSCARAMAMARDIPVIGFTTLEILAAQFWENHKQSCGVLIETKREDYYFQIFDANGKAATEPAALPGKRILEALGGDIVLTGDAVERFSREFPHSFKILPVDLPDVLLMARLAAEGKGQENPGPVYLRGPDVTSPKKPPHVLMK